MKSSETSPTYPPLNTLKPAAENVWIVDGPVIHAKLGFFTIPFPFPTRMTVIRLERGKLFIHSPTPLTPELKIELEKLGQSRWIIGPS